MKLFLLACIALPITLVAEGGLPNQPYIYVEGKGAIEKPADLIALSFKLVARAADQVKANEEVQSKAAKVLALLDARKVAAKDVVAQDLRSEAEFEQDQNHQYNTGNSSVTR